MSLVMSVRAGVLRPEGIWRQHAHAHARVYDAHARVYSPAHVADGAAGMCAGDKGI